MNRARLIAAAAAALALLAGCSAEASPDPSIQAPEPTAPSADPIGDGPERAYLAWLEEEHDPAPEVEIDVATKNVENAVLHATRADTGECRTIALEYSGSEWAITHDSEGCSRP